VVLSLLLRRAAELEEKRKVGCSARPADKVDIQAPKKGMMSFVSSGGGKSLSSPVLGEGVPGKPEGGAGLITLCLTKRGKKWTGCRKIVNLCQKLPSITERTPVVV